MAKTICGTKWIVVPPFQVLQVSKNKTLELNTVSLEKNCKRCPAYLIRIIYSNHQKTLRYFQLTSSKLSISSSHSSDNGLFNSKLISSVKYLFCIRFSYSLKRLRFEPTTYTDLAGDILEYGQHQYLPTI